MPNCPECGSSRLCKDGLRYTNEGQNQRYLCRVCGYRFSEHGVIFRDVKRSLRVDQKAKNLETTTEIETVAGEEKQATRGKILQFAFYLNKEGKSEGTISTYMSVLRRLSRHCDLEDPETVKVYLSKIKVADNTKATIRVTYTAFLTWQGRAWKPPKYTARSPIPEFIPTEQEIDQLISGTGKKTSTILQTIKETGMRIGECLRLTWTSLNDEANTLTLNKPEKHGLPRIFKISNKLVMMLQSLPKTHQEIFGVTKPKNAENSFKTARETIARKVKNPRLSKIHFHLIRHWFGTMEYHKTHDPDHVRRLLGHRSVLSSQIYINMEQAIFSGAEDEYFVKRAKTSKEEDSLISFGFEYVRYDDVNKEAVYRKRK